MIPATNTAHVGFTEKYVLRVEDDRAENWSIELLETGLQSLAALITCAPILEDIFIVGIKAVSPRKRCFWV